MLDSELVWKRRPGLKWDGRKAPDCQWVHYRSDDQGFRNPPGARQADLVFLGDSVTEAGEVVEEETFVRRTAERLGVSAVNLGVAGYGPQQELIVLKRYGLGYRPRAVVWQVTEWNDLEDAERFRDRDTPGARALPRWRTLYENHSPIVTLISAVLPARHKYMVDFQCSDGRIDQRVVWPYFNSATLFKPGLAETLSTLTAARRICRDRGIAFVVLLVPLHTRVLAPYARPRTPNERKRYEPPGGFDPPDDLGHALAAFCRLNDCPLIDLTDPLRRRAAVDNREVFLKNDTHLGSDGHDEAARELSRCLCSPQILALGKDRSDVPPRR